MKNRVAILALFAFLASYSFALAEAKINEVMYDLEGTDTGREWIEVKNDGPSAVDFSLYKLFEAEVNHSLVLIEGDKNIPTGGYAVIVSDSAKFKADHPNFLGTIFDSSFSLSNEGETLTLKDASLTIVDTYSYTNSKGASGDGKSLQKNASDWVAGLPTPGIANISSQGEAEQNKTSDTNSGGTSFKPELKYDKMQLEVITGDLGFTGIPVDFSYSILGQYAEPISYGKVYFNFGDGSSKEIAVSNDRSFAHIYKYKGDYLVSAYYYKYGQDQKPDAQDEVVLKVVPATVVISSVGNQGDFFIELENISDYDVDLFGWSLQSLNKKFTLPKATTLLSKKKIFLAPELTGLSYEDRDSLKLFAPSGYVAHMYMNNMSKKTSVEEVSSRIVAKNTVLIPPKKAETGITNFGEDKYAENIALAESLPAQAIGVVSNEEVISNTNFALIGFIFVVILGAVLVFYLRRSSHNLKAGDDFEILE